MLSVVIGLVVSLLVGIPMLMYVGTHMHAHAGAHAHMYARAGHPWQSCQPCSWPCVVASARIALALCVALVTDPGQNQKTIRAWPCTSHSPIAHLTTHSYQARSVLRLKRVLPIDTVASRLLCSSRCPKCVYFFPTLFHFPIIVCSRCSVLTLQQHSNAQPRLQGAQALSS